MAYSYDGNNKRVKTYDAVNDRTTIFVYDVNGLLAAEYTINVPPPSVPVISYLTEDALGSVRVTTNSFTEVKARRDFLPFGEELYAGIAGRNANQKYSLSTDDNRKKFATSATRKRASTLHCHATTRRCTGGSPRLTSSKAGRMSCSISRTMRSTIQRSMRTCRIRSLLIQTSLSHISSIRE